MDELPKKGNLNCVDFFFYTIVVEGFWLRRSIPLTAVVLAAMNSETDGKIRLSVCSFRSECAPGW